MEQNPFQQAPARGAIDPDQSQLFTGSRQAFEQESSPFGIGYAGSRHDDHKQQAQGIDQKMAFAAFDLVAGIVATHSRPLRGFDALAVHGSRRGVLMTTSTLANLGAKRVMDTLPGSISAKLIK